MHNPKIPSIENPRKDVNSFSQLLFTWLIPTLYRGSKNGLDQDDVTKCLDRDCSSALGSKLEINWQNEIYNAKIKNRPPLLKNALIKTFLASTILDGFFCAMELLFRTTLPVLLALLIKQFKLPAVPSVNNDNIIDSITLLNQTNEDMDTNLYNETYRNFDNNDTNSMEFFEESVWKQFNDPFILSLLLTIFAFLSCVFHHHADLRLRMAGARIRIACCSLIYRKTLTLSKKSVANTPAGYVVNLLSNDVSRFDYALVFAHYIWLLPLQSLLVGYLIWQQLGYGAIICVVGLLLKTVPIQTGLGHLLSILRLKVAIITDKRVGVMNEIIRGIQVIKMYAWEIPFAKIVAEIRRKEIQKIRLTAYIKAINTSTMVITERSTLFLAMLSCVLLAQSITADVVFSMAQYFNALQLTAANYYPFALAFGSEALVSVKRIEDYLLMEDRQEKSDALQVKSDNSKKETTASNAIDIKDVTASWDIDEGITLNNISLTIKPGQLCAIIGPVGAGKSSLLELLLGELPIQSGTSVINGNLAYSSQDSWLFTGTIRANILFDQAYDARRYKEVITCCALATDFDQLPNGDKTIVGERGASLSGGQQARINLARAVYKNASIYLLDDPLSAVDARVGGHLFNEVIGAKGRLAQMNATRILVTHQVHFLQEADNIVIIENGRILKQGTYEELANSDIDFAKMLKQQPEEEDLEEEIFIDDGPMTCKRACSMRKRSVRSSIRSINSDVFGEQEAEEQAGGSISPTVWKRYFLAGGNWLILTVFIGFMFFSQVIISGSDYFVNFWTQQEDLRNQNNETLLSTIQYLYIYGGFILAVILVCVVRSFHFYNICMTASTTLHNTMFTKMLTAPMRFFDINPCGRILNRFSKDMGTIDEILPKMLMDSIQICFVMLGILVMVSVLNPMMIVALGGAIVFFCIVLKLYLRPAQDLKRLEGIAKSPVFSHLASTLFGISTIRARSQETQLIKSFDILQNTHSGIWQLTMSANTALGFWLDIVSSAFVACVAFSFAAKQGYISSGDVGLAISQALILTGMVQYGVRQSAESMQLMTSVERVLQYTDINQEPSPSRKPPAAWPKQGRIQMKDMSLRYDYQLAPTLRNLTIEIEPGWKIGIVGRTGAGKSSLINAFFRLSPIAGEIIIDDIDTSQISLDGLRSKISIIPQDPVLFSDTIRNNLDPFHLYNDDALWRALADVELKASITTLDYSVTEGGSNFSVGQRQLICLARAILRNNKILVLDEATANVDPQTDALIQHTIRHKFKHCTVLTIAHRLHTVMDSDRILVMDAGTIKEFDYPHILLQNESGFLRNMVDATGVQESMLLRQIASDTYGKLELEPVIYSTRL